jgi:hypothetical protein
MSFVNTFNCFPGFLSVDDLSLLWRLCDVSEKGICRCWPENNFRLRYEAGRDWLTRAFPKIAPPFDQVLMHGWINKQGNLTLKLGIDRPSSIDLTSVDARIDAKTFWILFDFEQARSSRRHLLSILQIRSPPEGDAWLPARFRQNWWNFFPKHPLFLYRLNEHPLFSEICYTVKGLMGSSHNHKAVDPAQLRRQGSLS